VKLGDLVAVQDVESTILSPMPVVSQRKKLLKRSLGYGIAFGIVIAIYGIYKTGDIRVLPFGILFGTIFGVVVSILFDFLPALFKTKTSLFLVEMRTKDGNLIVFALKSHQIPEAKNVLARAGLAVLESDKDKSANAVEVPE